MKRQPLSEDSNEERVTSQSEKQIGLKICKLMVLQHGEAVTPVVDHPDDVTSTPSIIQGNTLTSTEVHVDDDVDCASGSGKAVMDGKQWTDVGESLLCEICQDILYNCIRCVFAISYNGIRYVFKDLLYNCIRYAFKFGLFE